MENWIRERAIKAHEEKQKADREELDALFKRLMWEIVGIDVGYVECCEYKLGEYGFSFHDPSLHYDICPDTAELYVSYVCPYISYHSYFSPCLGRALEGAADWGNFILGCEQHHKYCKQEMEKETQQNVEKDKKRRWFKR